MFIGELTLVRHHCNVRSAGTNVDSVPHSTGTWRSTPLRCSTTSPASTAASPLKSLTVSSSINSRATQMWRPPDGSHCTVPWLGFYSLALRWLLFSCCMVLVGLWLMERNHSNRLERILQWRFCLMQGYVPAPLQAMYQDGHVGKVWKGWNRIFTFYFYASCRSELQDVCHQSRKQKLVYAVMAVPCFSDIPGTFLSVQLPHFKVFFKYENEQAQMDTLCL